MYFVAHIGLRLNAGKERTPSIAASTEERRFRDQLACVSVEQSTRYKRIINAAKPIQAAVYGGRKHCKQTKHDSRPAAPGDGLNPSNLRTRKQTP